MMRSALAFGLIGLLCAPQLAQALSTPAQAQGSVTPPTSPLTPADAAQGYSMMQSQGLFGRAVSTTTDTGGLWSVTWTTPLVVPPANVQATPRATGVYCWVSSATTTGASGGCFGIRALPGSITLLTQLQNYSVTIAAQSVQVDVAAQATANP